MGLIPYISSMKKCRTCNEEKEINSTNFKKRKNSKDGHSNQCMKCELKESYERLNPNSERSIELRKLKEEKVFLLTQNKKRCYKCDEVKDINSENFYKNKSSKDGFHSTCKSCYVKWQKDNRTNINKKEKQRREEPLYNMMRTVRALVGKSFRDRIINKNTKTYKYLQCDWEKFKQHIESQFTEGMSWDNQGEWHFDHYYPISQVRNEKEMYMYNHYTNFQPLWANDNLTKNDKVPQGHKEWREKMTQLVDF